VTGECQSVPDAVNLILLSPPDVAVIDLSLVGANGFELVKHLSAAYPKVRTLVLSMHDELLFAERALRAGAHGYIMKQGAMRDVLTAIRTVAGGKTYVSPRVSTRILASVNRHGPTTTINSPLERLTDREREVFELIGNGVSTRQIAKQLRLSVKTIETHQAHIKFKLGLKNASELIRSATSWTQSL
jgi:DNA-binding NarL/FixJ family response regulator